MDIRIVDKDLNKSVIESIVDGTGFRLAVFTQGCKHYCKNCHNPTTWDMNGGYSLPVEELAEHIINRLKKSKYFAGITLTGGDPLYQKEAICELLKLIKEELPETNVWIYTGFLYEEVKDYELFKYVNTIVDGPFIEAEKDLTLKFRGSKNQRIININC